MLVREIIYPLFLECCHYANDDFWKCVFEDLAYGKPPYGTYISKGFLCCSYKDKKFSYKIEKISPSQLYSDIQGLLVSKLGILSNKERNQKKLLFTIAEDFIKESQQTWDGIKKKNVKDFLLENFVLRMQQTYKLTLKQTKEILSIISIAIMFKTIKNKDIKYNGQQILDINGITFSEGNAVFDEKLLITNDFNQVESELVKKRLSANWPKFLKKIFI